MPFFSPIIPTITLLAQMVIEYSTLEKRRTPAVHLWVRGLSLAFVYGGYWLLGRSGARSFLAYYPLTIAYVLACLYLFEESLAQKLFLYFASWGVTTFVSALCNWIAVWLSGGDGRQAAFRYALYSCAYLVILPLYLKFWRRRVKEILTLFEKGNKIYAAYPFLAFILFTLLFGPASQPATFGRFAVMVLFEGLVVFSYYLLFSQLHAAYAKMRAEENLRNTEKLVLLQKKYYEQVEAGVRRQRELSHDARHHLVAIASLAKAGDYGELERYTERLLARFDGERPLRFCENPVANAVIGGYIEIAEEKGIAVSVELDLPADIGIDAYELCTVFGNTLENAVEACERIPTSSELHSRRRIGVKSKVHRNRLIIRIENSFAGDIRKNRESFLSSKGSLGGIGLASVRNVVESHDGCLNCETSDGVFVVSAVLCLSRRP